MKVKIKILSESFDILYDNTYQMLKMSSNGKSYFRVNPEDKYYPGCLVEIEPDSFKISSESLKGSVEIFKDGSVIFSGYRGSLADVWRTSPIEDDFFAEFKFKLIEVETSIMKNIYIQLLHQWVEVGGVGLKKPLHHKKVFTVPPPPVF